jgi:hypothetical protein
METATEWAKNFEQRWDEYVLEKTTEELLSEGESLNDYFRMCEEAEQGISSKDVIRMRRIEKELSRRGAKLWWSSNF